MNKITTNYWFEIISNAVLYIVPFTMVAAIPSLWSIVRTFAPQLPDISPISDYSFGLIGLFIVFIIPHNTLVKEDRKDRALIAGFTGIGTYMLCMGGVATDEGTLFTFWNFGAGGMFTAMVVGFFVGLIYKKMAHSSFFGEDSPLPDFVKNWFDNILAILLSLFVAWVVTDVVGANVFTMIGVIMSPVTGFAQSLPGCIFITLVMDVCYFFGISGWAFYSVTSAIQTAALAENAAAIAGGMAATAPYAYGFSRYIMIGGEANTLALALMLLFFSKSKRNKLIGKATAIPSLLNTNEPLFFSSIVNNPFMFIPVVLQAIILPANAWLWMHFGLASMHSVMFDMYFLPCPISAFISSAGDWRNALLVVVNFALSVLIYYPFFKASDNYQLRQEQEIAKEAAA